MCWYVLKDKRKETILSPYFVEEKDNRCIVFKLVGCISYFCIYAIYFRFKRYKPGNDEKLEVKSGCENYLLICIRCAYNQLFFCSL